jgi:hypothetical protein
MLSCNFLVIRYQIEIGVDELFALSIEGEGPGGKASNKWVKGGREERRNCEARPAIQPRSSRKGGGGVVDRLESNPSIRR